MMMTPETARERGTLLLEQLTAAVASLAPADVATWPGAWPIVDPAGADFLVKLTAWEADPNEPARLKVRAAYDRVLASWRYATGTFEASRADYRQETSR